MLVIGIPWTVFPVVQRVSPHVTAPVLYVSLSIIIAIINTNLDLLIYQYLADKGRQGAQVSATRHGVHIRSLLPLPHADSTASAST